jgi:hypothetical protein
MLSKTQATANQVAEAMHQVYKQLSLDHHTYVTTVNHAGVRFVD